MDGKMAVRVSRDLDGKVVATLSVDGWPITAKQLAAASWSEARAQVRALKERVSGDVFSAPVTYAPNLFSPE